jgi:hypothetical protein
MRRARIVITLVTLALALCASGASGVSRNLNETNGIGLLDYSMKPTFKVGDYASYLVTATDPEGRGLERSVTTVLIAGQEVWWGERCFYVEAWVGDGKVQRSVSTTLMSYSVFEDSLPEENVQTYMRKMISSSDEGEPGEMLVSPGSPELTSRPAPSSPHIVRRDTLGADTVHTVDGTLRALKVLTHQAWSRTSTRGDSTIYEEIREDRTQWICGEIPLTRCALEETRTARTRRAWLIGHSGEAAREQVVVSGITTARILGYGHGLKSLALPADRVHSFDDPPAGKRTAPAARPRTTSGGARRR